VDVTKENWLDASKGFNTVHRIYMMSTFALLTKRFGTADHSGHNIAAILADKTGHILSWGLNQRWNNATFHAELNMLQAYCKGHKADPGLPDGARIYTTLKPCKMCAGMIRETAININNIVVYYGQNDPGQHASATALDLVQGYNIQRLLSHCLAFTSVTKHPWVPVCQSVGHV
jgi:tRNA(Arg) A34 adenosine deaminase TadA